MNSKWKKIPDLGAARLLGRTNVGHGVLRLTFLREDEKISFLLSERAYDQLGAPQKGDVLIPRQGTAFTRAANRRGAVQKALRILATGDNSKTALSIKLRKVGYDRDEVDYALSVMEQNGFLREEEFALRKVELCAKRGWSERKIYSYLSGHGYQRDIIGNALATAKEEGLADFSYNREQFIQKKTQEGIQGEALKRALWQAGFPT